MKNLKIVSIDTDGCRQFLTKPMEEWIADWWFDCNFVPSNDAVIWTAELDGESILDKIEQENDKVIFWNLAKYLKWDAYWNRFVTLEHAGERPTYGASDRVIEKETFIKWLKETYL